MFESFSPSDQSFLLSILSQARQSPPSDWVRWSLHGHQKCLGIMPPSHAEILSSMLTSHMPLRWEGDEWVWYAQTYTAFERSHVLQNIALMLRSEGVITGWRDELYACWGYQEGAWPYDAPELFRLERAAFRYFGLRSHAAHVHGLTATQHMWCGRRSLKKPTDPGLLDNLAAGGLPADESPSICAVREIYEEAGLHRTDSDLGLPVSTIITERAVPEGWHSECLFVYCLKLSDTEQPKNQDGEVSEFLCLPMVDVLARMRANEFTADAACAIAVTYLDQSAKSSK